MLSDDKVIAELYKSFVPVEINITTKGWPDEAQGLWPWKLAYTMVPHFKNGFVFIIALDPTGKRVVHEAGNPGIENVTNAASYNPDKFLVFLDETKEKFAKLK